MLLYTKTILALLFLFCSFCVAQDNKQSKIYDVVDIKTEQNAQGENQTLTTYKYKGNLVTTIELYFSSKDEQEKRLREIMFENGSCEERTLINNKSIIFGSAYTCYNVVNGKKVAKVGYSYFDSLNKITIIFGQELKTIESFVKGICPLASELYNEPGCPEIRDLRSENNITELKPC